MAQVARAAFVVSGRVQGVGFRMAAARAAWTHGVVGFVRNRADGAVEGEAQGDATALAAFRAWLQRGPTLARVDALDWRELAVLAGETSFDVRR